MVVVLLEKATLCVWQGLYASGRAFTPLLYLYSRAVCQPGTCNALTVWYCMGRRVLSLTQVA